MRFGISCFVSSFAHFTILWKHGEGRLILQILLRLGHDVDSCQLYHTSIVLRKNIDPYNCAVPVQGFGHDVDNMFLLNVDVVL